MSAPSAKKTPPSKRVVKTRAAKTGVGDMYKMANLYPRDTGLPMTIWVSPRGFARHDARIKVCLSSGDKMDATNTAVVGIRPAPRIIKGPLGQSDYAPVAAWISLNEAALIGYWDGTLGTIEFVTALRRCQPEPAQLQTKAVSAVLGQR